MRIRYLIKMITTGDKSWREVDKNAWYALQEGINHEDRRYTVELVNDVEDTSKARHGDPVPVGPGQFRSWLIEYTKRLAGERGVMLRDMEAAFDAGKSAIPKMFICDSLRGHWPVGGEAIVIAYDIAEAVELLNKQVALEGLPEQIVKPEQLKEVDCATPRAIIINDGNY